MKEFKFSEMDKLAEKIGCKEWEILKNYEDNSWRGQLFINGRFVNIEVIDDELLLILIEHIKGEDEEYFMKYSVKNYKIMCYIDDIEQWQECELLNIKNFDTDCERATVKTKNNTQVNRLTKNIYDEEELKADGCIYFIEK